MFVSATWARPQTDNCSVACPDVFGLFFFFFPPHRMFDQPVVSRLAATHLATHERETYYYKVGVTSLCQSQSAGLAFLNSCGCQLLAISATTELGAFLSLTIRVAMVGGGGGGGSHAPMQRFYSIAQLQNKLRKWSWDNPELRVNLK